MNDYLNASTTGHADPRAAGGDHRLTHIDQRDAGNSGARDDSQRGSRKCALETGARGWRWVVQTH